MSLRPRADGERHIDVVTIARSQKADGETKELQQQRITTVRAHFSRRTLRRLCTRLDDEADLAVTPLLCVSDDLSLAKV